MNDQDSQMGVTASGRTCSKAEAARNAEIIAEQIRRVNEGKLKPRYIR